MKCPHCGKAVEIRLAKTVKRTAYWQSRHIKSGKAKVRTSIDMIGRCIDCLVAPVVGRRHRCDPCHEAHTKRRHHLAYQRKYGKANIELVLEEENQ